MRSEEKNYIEVVFSPLLFPVITDTSAIVVVIDVLRATSAICTAFAHGAKNLIPVETVEEARKYKDAGYIVAAERDGYVKEFADFGNSPFNFTKERVAGKTIVYSTTNGTRTVHQANDFHKIVLGAFINISALAQWLAKESRNVIILCAGWKGRFNLEDSIMAGALTEQLLQYSDIFMTDCDSAKAATDLWALAQPDIVGYIEKAAQRSRLRQKKLDDVLPFCFSYDYTNAIPLFNGQYLINVNKIDETTSL